MNHNQLTIGQLLKALVDNKVKCATVFLLTFAAVVAYWRLAPREYGSEGRMVVRMGSQSTPLQVAKGTVPVSIQKAPETEVRTVMELLKSDQVVGMVVEDETVTAEAVLESPFDVVMDLIPSFGGSPASDGISAEEAERLLNMQKAVKQIQKNLTVEMEKDTSSISVYVTAHSPELAKAIVDKLMEYCAEVHLDVYSRSESQKFFAKEMDNQAEELAKAENELMRFRNSESRDEDDYQLPFLSIEGPRNSLQGVISRLESEMIDLELGSAQALAEVKALDEELVSIGKFIETPTQGVEKLSTESASEEVFKLKSERADLIATYKTHPKIDIINSRLASLEKDFGNLEADRTEMAVASNPAFEDVSVARATAEARAKALSVRLELAKGKYATALDDLKKLNATELKVAKLRRQKSAQDQWHANLVDRRGDTSLFNQLNKEKLSDIHIYQPGRLWLKHVSPKGSILLPLGFLMASGLALITALMNERSEVFAQESEAEQVLDLPVLVTLPRVANRRAMVR